MPDSIATKIARLQTMTADQLREQWRHVVGGKPRSSNRVWLLKRLAWAIQANEHGGLPARAQGRLDQLLAHTDTWMAPRKSKNSTPPPALPRTPALAAGIVLTRLYKGRTLTVLVREDGRFEFEGALYDSLTAIARAVTGSHWNGNLFFRITPPGKRA